MVRWHRTYATASPSVISTNFRSAMGGHSLETWEALPMPFLEDGKSLASLRCRVAKPSLGSYLPISATPEALATAPTRLRIPMTSHSKPGHKPLTSAAPIPDTRHWTVGTTRRHSQYLLSRPDNNQPIAS